MLPSRALLLTFLSGLTACVAAAPAPARNGFFVGDTPETREFHEPPPPCPATVTETVASGSGGVKPFDSNSALAASVGATVYVVAPTDEGPAVMRRPRHVFAFGEPVVLCRVKPLRNPGQVLSEEIFYGNNVLVKERGGDLYNLPIHALSPVQPRFSMTAPGTADATVIGAFREAMAAKEALSALPPAGKSAGSPDSPTFWMDQSRAAFTATQRSATNVLHRIVTARPSRGATSATCGGGECWYARSADPKLALWMTQGIDDGGKRDAYVKLLDCYQRGTSCDEARAIAASPPTATGAPTIGGKLLVHVNPPRLAAGARLEIDGAAAKLDGNSAELTFAKDGSHTVTVVAKGSRPDTRSAMVKEGRTVDLNLVLLPGGK